MGWICVGRDNGDWEAEFVLPFKLEASIEDVNQQRETIVLKRFGFKKIRVWRKTEGVNSLMGAQTSDKEDERGNVVALIIQFRPYDDPHTDRGVLWVEPDGGGLTSRATFTLKASAVENPKLTEKIVKEASEALEWRFLKLFEICS